MNAVKFTWEDVRVFEAAAGAGSLSAGAKSLGLSQPQMSRRLRELERLVGARLFDRTPQGLRPTAAGARLMPLAESMRKAAESIERALPGLANDAVNIVRISVDEIREHFISARLGDLRRKLPGIGLEIFSGHEHLDHESRMTDVQVRSCLPDSETLIAKRLGETGYGLYASKEFLKRHPRGKDMAGLPWIGVSPDHLWYPRQKQWLDGFFSSTAALRCNTMTAMLNAAACGEGLALLPHFMARDRVELKEVIVSAEPLFTVEYLIVHRDLLREPAVRKLVDALTALYKANRATLRGERLPGRRKR